MFCLLLFGYSGLSGRPLSLHEARLPECSREMYWNGDWVIPRSGGRPWLERPPLPHWVTVGTSVALGQKCDSVWVVRLPAAVMGGVSVLLVAWMAGRWFGRAVGMCGGLILATAYEFFQYSSLAEDDIYLAALETVAIAPFVLVQFPRGREADGRVSFWGGRPWAVTLFFVVLGLTNLVKGPLVGAAVVGASVGVFLLLGRDGVSIRRYFWVWGWIILVALTVAWPLAVYHRYPEVMENWRFDYAGGTRQYDKPFWYYPLTLLGELAPWTPAVVVGLLVTWKMRGARPLRRSGLCGAGRLCLLWCCRCRTGNIIIIWCRVLAPWAILGAIGILQIARRMFEWKESVRRPMFGLLALGLPGAAAFLLLHRKIPGPLAVTVNLAIAWVVCVTVFFHGLRVRRGGPMMAALVAGIAIAYCWGESYLPDQTTQDTVFLKRVEAEVAQGQPLMINSDLHGELDFFRIGFYLRPDARLLHNLSFLRDERIHDPTVYVITRARDVGKLETLGAVEAVLQSARTRRENSPGDRFTLFRLTFRTDLQRYPAPREISTMEAMGRKTGPWCGSPL